MKSEPLTNFERILFWIGSIGGIIALIMITLWASLRIQYETNPVKHFEEFFKQVCFNDSCGCGYTYIKKEDGVIFFINPGIKHGDYCILTNLSRMIEMHCYYKPKTCLIVAEWKKVKE